MISRQACDMAPKSSSERSPIAWLAMAAPSLTMASPSMKRGYSHRRTLLMAKFSESCAWSARRTIRCPALLRNRAGRIRCVFSLIRFSYPLQYKNISTCFYFTLKAEKQQKVNNYFSNKDISHFRAKIDGKDGGEAGRRYAVRAPIPPKNKPHGHNRQINLAVGAACIIFANNKFPLRQAAPAACRQSLHLRPAPQPPYGICTTL